MISNEKIQKNSISAYGNASFANYKQITSLTFMCVLNVSSFNDVFKDC